MKTATQSISLCAEFSPRIAERRAFLAFRKIGGIWFMRLGRINVSFSVSK